MYLVGVAGYYSVRYLSSPQQLNSEDEEKPGSKMELKQPFEKKTPESPVLGDVDEHNDDDEEDYLE